MRILIAAAVALISTGALAQEAGGGSSAGQSPVPMDATTKGEAATMDGTMPIDASKATGGGAAASADQTNAGASQPVPGTAATTGDVATDEGMAGSTVGVK